MPAHCLLPTAAACWFWPPDRAILLLVSIFAAGKDSPSDDSFRPWHLELEFEICDLGRVSTALCLLCLGGLARTTPRVPVRVRETERGDV